MKMVSIEAVREEEHHRKDYGDALPSDDPQSFAALCASIDKKGLLQALVVNSGLQLLAGRRRLRALRHLGWCSVPVRIVDTISPLEAEWEENEIRKDLTPSERVAVYKHIQKQFGRRGERTDLQKRPVRGKKAGKRESRERAAKSAGLGSARTAAKAKKVVESGNQDLIDRMDSGELSVHQAAERLTPAPSTAQPIGGDGAELSAMKDANGELLPMHVADVFQDLTSFKLIVKQIDALLAEARQLSAKPSGRYLMLSQIESNLKAARNQFVQRQPHSLCPYCKARTPDCTTCGGAGFVHKEIANAAQRK